MGMFDDVRIHLPLPGIPAHPLTEFQSKDFDCALRTYTVTETGELWREVWTGEIVPDPDHPLGVSYQRDSWYSQKVIDAHGKFNVYTDLEDGQWLELVLTFTHGRIEKVTQISPSHLEITYPTGPEVQAARDECQRWIDNAYLLINAFRPGAKNPDALNGFTESEKKAVIAVLNYLINGAIMTTDTIDLYPLSGDRNGPPQKSEP